MLEVEANAVRVMQVCTNTPFKVPEGAEVINMCKAIEYMITEGERKGKLEILIGLVKDGFLDISIAADRAGITVEEFEAEMNKAS